MINKKLIIILMAAALFVLPACVAVGSEPIETESVYSGRLYEESLARRQTGPGHEVFEADDRMNRSNQVMDDQYDTAGQINETDESMDSQQTMIDPAERSSETGSITHNSTATPTLVPTITPATTPSSSKTPTSTPVPMKSSSPTTTLTKAPTSTTMPTKAPTPTLVPTKAPTPTLVPTKAPTPTTMPTKAPTPTTVLTKAPTPTPVPTKAPTPTPVPTKAPTPTPTPVVEKNVDWSNQSIEQWIAEIFRLTNKERTAAGVPVLAWPSAQLQQAAMIRAEEIAASFSHDRPDGQSCFTVLDECSVTRSTAGENLLYSTKGAISPQGMVDAWMASEGHRKNILNPKFKSVGIGFFQVSGYDYVTQLFIG